MNKQQKIGYLIMGVAFLAPIITEAVASQVRTRNFKRNLQAELERELTSLEMAKQIVLRLIAQGYYRDHPGDPLEDLDFYKIICREGGWTMDV